jgi:hypothetical protein
MLQIGCGTVIAQKNLETKISQKIFWNFLWNFFLKFFFEFNFFLKTWVAEICKADPRVIIMHEMLSKKLNRAITLPQSKNSATEQELCHRARTLCHRAITLTQSKNSATEQELCHRARTLPQSNKLCLLGCANVWVHLVILILSRHYIPPKSLLLPHCCCLLL